MDGNQHEIDRSARHRIAIVGLSALFPKSRNLREFWGNVVEAADCIQDVPATHWRPEDYYDSDPTAEDKTYCRRGGFLPEIGFDPLEFGLPPNILEVTDVLQLLSLVVAREVLGDAGCPGASWYDPSRTGVILGITGSNSLTQPLSARLQTPVLKEVVRSCGLTERDAEEIAEKFKKAYIPWQENSFPGMLGNVVAGRIANRFDLGGLNCTVDAACASSLAAVRMAASELAEGRADLMITGGCDTENTIMSFMCFSKTPALSKSGQIRPFDEAADGTLIGEGIGMLALKRLADAERDNDRIYAVLRGIGTGSDGRFKSIYAPRSEGQQRTLDRAYADADCSPDSVELIEAHGTGTVAGDRTELAALREVYSAATEEKQFAALGSVKSQIGHTKAAAGAAGLIKLALALHHKVLPPTINVERPTQAIRFDQTPFYVNTESRPWVRHPGRPRRRAAISSFGFGGTNFHCVLEEHDALGHDVPALHPTARAYLWHAENHEALCARLAEGAPAAPDEEEIPAAHTRLGFVARTDAEATGLREQALATLRARGDIEEWTHPKGVYYRRRARGRDEKVAALFAGQGSQYVNMGREAALAVPPIRAAFDRANEQFIGDTPLSRIVFPVPVFEAADRDEQEALLRQTEFAQPAIGALSSGQHRFLSALGFSAHGFLGHSFGELTALWAAGCFSDADYYTLARARGLAMAPPPLRDGRFDSGAMAAVQATQDRVRELLVGHPDVDICNYNTSDQFVVGGATAAVERFVAASAAAGVRTKLLPVAAAFHTPLVEHAVEAFRKAVEEVEFRPGRGTVYANTAGRTYGEDLAANRSILTEQLLHPVHFADRIETMYADGYRIFVEFGPKGVLKQFVSRILGDREAVVISLDGGPSQDSDLRLKQAAVQLAVCGLPLTGLNRFTGPPPTEPPAAMSIPFTGVNHVSEGRRREYREALQNGYRISAPVSDQKLREIPAAGPSSPASPAVPPPVPQRPAVPPTTTAPAAEITESTVSIPNELSPNLLPASSETLTQYAADHLTLHRAYLDGQLQVATRLVGLLEQHTLNGDGDNALMTGLSAVKDHSLAISETHLRAQQVLRDFAALDLGHRPDSQATTSARAIVDLANAAATPPDPIPPTIPIVPAPETWAAAPAPLAAPGGPASGAAVGLDAASVQSALLAIVADKTGYPVEMLEPDMDVEADLGIDSIKRVEILSGMRERFPAAPEVGPETLGELRTLRDITDFLAGSTPTESQTAPEPSGERIADAEAPTDVPMAPIGRTRVTLRALPAPDLLVSAYAAPRTALVVDDGGGRGAALNAALRESGWDVQVLRLPGVHGPHDPDRLWQLDEWHENELSARLSDIVAASQGLSLCLYLATADAADWAQAQRRLAFGLLVAKHLQRPLEDAAQRGRAAFVAVTGLDGALGLNGSATPPNAVLGGIAGMVKTLAIEAPRLFCRNVDIAPAVDDAAAAALVLAELHDIATDPPEVGLDGDHRLTSALDDESARLEEVGPAALGPDDVLVVTGGARGVTAACVTELARRHPVHLVLLGRTRPAPEHTWAAGVTSDADLKHAIYQHLSQSDGKPTIEQVSRLFGEITAQRQIRATLQALHAAGATAEYLPVDITDPDATSTALAPYADRVAGVVHGAGVLADRLVADKTPREIERVLAPKIDGLHNVLAALDSQRLRHLVLFSSVAGFFGNRGQSDYAMANEALNRLACSLEHERPDCRITSINWGAWDGGMVSDELRTVFRARGLSLIPVEDGAAIFADQFDRTRDHDVVTVIGPAAGLSHREPHRPVGRTVAQRRIAGLGADPIMESHRIDGHPVLPATVALGCMINVVEQLHGEPVVECRDFRVHKGVVFEGTQPERFEVEMSHEAAGHDEVAIRGLRESGPARPHYAAACVVGEVAGPTATSHEGLAELLAETPSDSGSGPYEDGSLFHGPTLRGITRILLETPDRLIVQCRLSDRTISNGAYEGRRYSPVLADLLLQAPLLWARRMKDRASLPVGIERVDLLDRLPHDEPFVLVVDQIHDSETTITCTVSACAVDGRVLQRFAGVSVVCSPQLKAKFAPSRREDTDAA
ncbi:SDR family NAD(P)-dependent oxidoreductase [Nocardia nepalensis]|uniref:SDR family NAD(P)-dependent oxidoreductase n=1 Tax=Nocardia nepalensis TaxID=3375448 RepID=UPI003B671A0E